MGAVRTVAVKLVAQFGGYVSETTKAATATRGLMGELDTLGRKSPEKLNRVALAAGAVGLSLLTVAAAATKAAMEFDKQMSAVGAVANATAGDMDLLRDAAREAGKATIFSATEAAKAEEELAKAGISTADILGGALTGALSLAAAGQMELADAATIAAQAMNVFRLQGRDVPHIADVLASAANKSAADMKDLGDALKQGGNVAAAAGLSLEDTTGVLAAFADRALVGADAGTSLKSMLLALQAPSQKATNLMQQLGIKVYDAQGRFIGAAKLAGVLQKQLGGLTQAERNHALATIFGSDATRAATVLYTLGESGLRDYIDAVNDSGAAAETAAKKTDNLAGDVERLKGTLSDLAIESGSGANKALRGLVQVADTLLTDFSKLPGPIQSTAVMLAGVAGSGLLVAAAAVKIHQTLGEVTTILTDMGPAGAAAAKGINATAKALTYVGIAAAGLALAFEGYKLLQHLEGLDKLSQDSSEDVKAYADALLELGKSGVASGKLAQVYGRDLAGLRGEFDAIARSQKSLASAQKSGFAGLIGGDAERAETRVALVSKNLDDVDQALAELASNGNASAALLSLIELSKQTGINFGDLKAKLPLYTKAANDAATANTGLAQGFASASQQAGILTGGLEQAIDAGQTLIDVWNELHGATLDADKAMLKANQAIADVKKSFEDNGKAISGNTDAALKNRIAVEEAAQAAADAAEKKRIEGGTLEDAKKVYDDYIVSLRKALHDEGLSKQQIDDLIAAYAKMPDLKATTISTPGMDTVLHNLQLFKDALDRLPWHKDVAVGFKTAEHAAGNRWGGVYQHAATGLLNEAAVYSATDPGRYMIAEPQTGGEAFVPKYGSYSRSMGILSEAAGWYGASVVPGGGGFDASSITIYATIDGEQLQARIDRTVVEGNRGTQRRVMARTGRRR